jgi:hypothetical protein
VVTARDPRYEAGGGELVVGNNAVASSLAEIEQDCSVIRPHSGHLVVRGPVGSQTPAGTALVMVPLPSTVSPS